MNKDESLLALMEKIQQKAPEYVSLLTASSLDEFESAFLPILERALSGLESNSKNYAQLKEEGLTAVLAQALSIPGFTVTQETNSNGHVDITIVANHCMPMRKKLGEAKVWDGTEWHLKGVEQLLGKYTTGRETRGLVISFVRTADIAGLFKKVRERMDKELPHQQQKPASDLALKWSFQTDHLHPCGEILEVAHVGCNMFVTAPKA